MSTRRSLIFLGLAAFSEDMARWERLRKGIKVGVNSATNHNVQWLQIVA